VAQFAANPGTGANAPVAEPEEDILDLLSEYAVVRVRPLAG
jgi:hypothetical protein